jgi:hypothetical protein
MRTSYIALLLKYVDRNTNAYRKSDALNPNIKLTGYHTNVEFEVSKKYHRLNIAGKSIGERKY